MFYIVSTIFVFLCDKSFVLAGCIIYQYNNVVGIKCTLQRLDSDADTAPPVNAAFTLRMKLEPNDAEKVTELATLITVSLEK